MKKIVYSLILSSLVGSSITASGSEIASKLCSNVKDHYVAYGLGAASVVTAGFISYDLLKNDAKFLRKAGLLTVDSYKKVTKLAKKHPIVAAALITLATGAGAGAEVYLRGDNSFVKKYSKAGYDKVTGLFSSSEKASEKAAE